MTVGVAGSPTVVITPPATTPNAGLPAVFTFVVTPAGTNPTPVKDVTVDWGDGTVQSLGAITGTSTQSHVYNQARPSYIIKATLTDAFGNQVFVTSSVTVITGSAANDLSITPTVPTTHSGTAQPSRSKSRLRCRLV